MPEIEFAPLQGYTDAAYRKFHNEIYEGCIGCYYTPFVRLERCAVRERDKRDLDPKNNKGINLVPQIIVNSRDELITLTDIIVSMGYSEIDINMGCPFPLQMSKKRGAGLLPHVEIVAEILHEISCLTHISFSLKMRLGLNDAQDCFNLLPIINDTPFRQVTIHPRLGVQQYKGNVDIDMFARLYGLIKHPLVYNGDIISREDIDSLMRTFPNLKGIMIGRGLLRCPSLAMEYKNGISLSDEQRLSMFLLLHDRLFDYYSGMLQGDAQLLMKMKTVWDYQEPVVGHKYYKAIKKSTTINKYLSTICLLKRSAIE